MIVLTFVKISVWEMPGIGKVEITFDFMRFFNPFIALIMNR